MKLLSLIGTAVAVGVTGSKFSLRGKSLMKLPPVEIAKLFDEVKGEWMDHALLSLEKKETVSQSRGEMVESCSTVVASIIEASEGEKSKVEDYLNDVCNVSHEPANCHLFGDAVLGLMSEDSASNRDGLDINSFCVKFYGTVEDQAIIRKKESDAAAKAKKAKEDAEKAKKTKEIKLQQEAAKKAKELAAKKRAEELKHKAEKAALQKAKKEKEAAEAMKKALEEQHKKAEEKKKAQEEAILKLSEAKKKAEVAMKKAAAEKIATLKKKASKDEKKKPEVKAPVKPVIVKAETKKEVKAIVKPVIKATAAKKDEKKIIKQEQKKVAAPKNTVNMVKNDSKKRFQNAEKAVKKEESILGRLMDRVKIAFNMH